MKCGLDLPTYGEFADPRIMAGLARDAEAHGWDGFFVYDQIAPEGELPLADPWIVLAAIALATSTIRLGTLVTPLPRRRPSKVARETATLDQLSNGRLILGVGLGNSTVEFDDLGEQTDIRLRGAMLDEALTVLCGLWSGHHFSFDGAFYHVRGARFLPAPVQAPRIPIWVAGTWPAHAPFRRAARWDGVFPHYRNAGGTIGLMPPDALRDMSAFVQTLRPSDDIPFATVLRGSTPIGNAAQAAAIVEPYKQAGLSWWLEGVDGGRNLAMVRERIVEGPPGRQGMPPVL